jgi:hypothetical protein
MIGYTPMAASNARDWTPDEPTVDPRAELRTRVQAVTARRTLPDPPDHLWDSGDVDRDPCCSCRQNPCAYHEPMSWAQANREES